MKVSKILKTIDLGIIQKLAMILIAAIFIYIFYYYYGLFTGYQVVKESEAGRKVERIPVSPPVFYNFTPGDEEHPDIDKYQIFIFKEKKATPEKAEGQGVIGSDPGKGSGYQILGVVKKDKLFLVVRFDSDNKIRLFSQGMTIKDNIRVKKITTQQVVISDPAGDEQIHNIFSFAGVKEIDLEKIKKMKKEDKNINMGAKDNVDDTDT